MKKISTVPGSGFLPAPQHHTREHTMSSCCCHPGLCSRMLSAPLLWQFCPISVTYGESPALQRALDARAVIWHLSPTGELRKTALRAPHGSTNTGISSIPHHHLWSTPMAEKRDTNMKNKQTSKLLKKDKPGLLARS